MLPIIPPLNGDPPDFFAADLFYISKDKPVFLCSPVDKRPLTKNGFKDSTLNPDEARANRHKYPHAAIGIPTGRASGWFVVDVDVKNGKNGFETLSTLEKQYGKLPETLMAQTPSGGRHYIFTYPPALDSPLGNSVEKLGPGIDTRGEGGYVCVPPSQLENGSYCYSNIGVKPAILPDWIIKLLQKTKTGSAPSTAPQTGPSRLLSPFDCANGGTPYGLKALENIAAEMASTHKGQRNDTLNRLALRIGSLVAGGELQASAQEYLKQAARQSGLAVAEIEKTAKSGYEAGFKSPATAPKKSEYQRQKLNPKIVGGNSQAQNTAPPPTNGTGTNSPETMPDPACIGAKINQDRMAQIITDEFCEDWRYDHDRKIWLIWNGNNWRPDKKGQVFHQIRLSCRNNNPKEKANLGSFSFISGVELLLRNTPPMRTLTSAFDQNDLLVGCPNGVLDLTTGRFGQGNRDDLISLIAGTDPSDDENCPRWLQFITQCVRGDVDFGNYLKKCAGYVLSGATSEQVFFFFHGAGGNGKSVFLKTLQAVLGDYSATSNFNLFAEKKNEQPTEGLASLLGKRLVVSSEVNPGHYWDEAKIKALTGGDSITCRRLYGREFSYTPKYKIIVAGNNQPALRNVDDAIGRRIRMLPFVNRPEKPDKNLEAALRQELPGILRWAAKGFLNWQAEGLISPAAIREASDDYIKTEDIFALWLEEECYIDENATSRARELCQSWNAWRDRQQEKPWTETAFGRKLKAEGFTKDHGANGSIYRGLSLRCPS